jgi:hypothetical protein
VTPTRQLIAPIVAPETPGPDRKLACLGHEVPWDALGQPKILNDCQQIRESQETTNSIAHINRHSGWHQRGILALWLHNKLAQHVTNQAK